jgi:hypothetical protein
MGRAALVGVLVAGALFGDATIAEAAWPGISFGGNPHEAVTPTATCGAAGCTLYWSNPSVGSDRPRLPASGGYGDLETVTLPAMPNPGTMRVVALVSSESGGPDAAHPDHRCCEVYEVSQPFTVPPEQVRTVGVAMHVIASEAADLRIPGDTSSGDGFGISVLTPGTSLPVRLTGDAADSAFFWTPAIIAPALELVRPTGVSSGERLLARFSFIGPLSDGVASEPGYYGPDPRRGVTLAASTFRPGPDGRTLDLGTVASPATVKTTQTLTAPGSGRDGEPLVLGRGRTQPRRGTTVPMKLTLNGKCRAVLARTHSLKLHLTIMETNARGSSLRVTRTVTVKSAEGGA